MLEKWRILKEVEHEIESPKEKQKSAMRYEGEEAEFKREEFQIVDESLKRQAKWCVKMGVLQIEVEMKTATINKINK